MRYTETQIEQTPAGKRTVRQNVYGNWNGYVSGRFWKNFGCDCVAGREAQEWAIS